MAPCRAPGAGCERRLEARARVAYKQALPILMQA